MARAARRGRSRLRGGGDRLLRARSRKDQRGASRRARLSTPWRTGWGRSRLRRSSVSCMAAVTWAEAAAISRVSGDPPGHSKRMAGRNSTMMAEGSGSGGVRTRVEPERRPHHDGEHLDAQPAEAERPRDVFAPRGHDHRVVASVRHDRDDRHPGLQGEADKPGPPTEVDRVAVAPRATGLPVAPGIHHDGRAFRQGRPCALGSSGEGAEAAQRGPDHGQREEQVVGEGVGGVVEAAPVDKRQRRDPDVWHVEDAVVVPDDEHRSGLGDVLHAPDLG